MTKSFAQWQERIRSEAWEAQERARLQGARAAVCASRVDRWKHRLCTLANALIIGGVLMALYGLVTYCMELIQGVR